MAKTYDCIVIGGGHAGAEAAHSCARLGAPTLLITLSRDSIARASCNPAIGGLAKGQIVREIDALGGLMGLAADATGIQFRMLNRSKGPAVRSPRAQIDKHAYAAWVRQKLENTPNLTIAETMAEDIITDAGRVCGVRCADASSYAADCVIVTTGTFLRGVMHIGSEQFPGGRLNEPASVALSESLRRLGLEIGRLKTGTPVRLAGDTIDYGETEEQPGDEHPEPFSFMTGPNFRPVQVPCWITYTNADVHRLLLENLERAPLFTGQIASVGPRYCPSIETKVMRFADKERHQVFLEPEDRAGTTIYANGISTSVPRDVQERMLTLMPGTRQARIVHYAYAIEYDYCPAHQLKINLETRRVPGLFLAGQINGTSGYEEAAAQGLIAGINVVRKLRGDDPLVLGRDQAYIGVLIDDLLTKALSEPYRMFTSRAEYRLSLRSDNADRRLTAIGRDIGLVDDARWVRFEAKLSQIEAFVAFLKGTKTGGTSLWQRLKQPENAYAESIYDDPAVAAFTAGREIIDAAVIDARYEGYLAKQEKQISQYRQWEHVRLPDGLDYAAIPHLRAEAKERLGVYRPHTLGQAGRIGGITPADVTVIQIYLKKRRSI